MKAKLINIGQAGCGDYRVEIGSVVIGYLSRTKNTFYQDGKGNLYPIVECKDVWVAQLANGNEWRSRTVGAFGNRTTAVTRLIDAAATAQNPYVPTTQGG